MKQETKLNIAGFAPLILVVISFTFIFFVFKKMQVDMKPILTVAVFLTPIWLPLMLFYITYDQWMWGIHEKFKFKSGRTTLRIKLPQEILKSPEAMESVLRQTHITNSPYNLMQAYLQGKHAMITSFEIASVEGEVRFYVNVPNQKVRNNMESQLYAQYPGVELIEEKVDYAAEIKWDPEKTDFISFHIIKKKDDVLPINTYLDMGMDKLPKEEEKFEPMAPLLEHIASVKPHEKIWIQILLKPHGKASFSTGSLFRKDTWEKAAQKKVDELMKRDQEGKGEEETESRPVLTMSERDTIAAIERNTSKYAYETAIRAMYITVPGKFDADMISPMLNAFGQYDVIGRNSIGPMWRTDFDYKFLSDFSGKRVTAMKKFELESYKNRFYLHGDKKRGLDKPKVMSVEELATIYHLPGTSIVTPSVSRVDTTRREAPANLPIQLPGS